MELALQEVENVQAILNLMTGIIIYLLYKSGLLLLLCSRSTVILLLFNLLVDANHDELRTRAPYSTKIQTRPWGPDFCQKSGLTPIKVGLRSQFSFY